MQDKPKDLIFGNEAQVKMAKGLDKLADAVKVTLGPRGRNVIIERNYGSPSITKDGVSVAKEINLKDPVENMGAQMAKDVASKTCDEAGDGTTTATVLAQAITQEGIRVVDNGGSPVELKRGMDIAVDRLVKALRQAAHPADTVETIARVGAISANNEQAVGDILAEAIDKVGQTGVVTIEESSEPGISLELIEGLQLDEGMISPHLIPDDNATEVTHNDPVFLLINKQIDSIKDLIPMIESVNKIAERPHLVIICHGISQPALIQVISNIIKGIINVSIIRAPGFGEKKIDGMRDLAVALGSKLYGSVADGCTSLEEATVGDLGQAGRIKISLKNTTIFEPCGIPQEIQDRVIALQAAAKATESEYDRENILGRVAKLSGAMAVVNVGGRSEVEAKELRDRVEDAMHATRAAVEEGIVEGGGVALLKARAALAASESEYPLTEDQNKGVKIVMKAIESPIRNILINAGYSPDVIINDIINDPEGKGFNAHTGKYEDLLETGVIDPVKVTITALRNAVSIAGMLITTNCAITHDRSVEDLPALGQY